MEGIRAMVEISAETLQLLNAEMKKYHESGGSDYPSADYFIRIALEARR